MRSVKEQDAARFQRIAATYGDRLLAYAARRTSADEAADVVAETLLTAWRRVRIIPSDDEQALWWLLAIARRTIANHRRGIVRRTALAERLRGLAFTDAGAEDHDAAVEAATAQGLVRRILTHLGDDDQELVRLVYWDGLTIRAAAAVVGTSEAAARKRLQRARDRMRIALKEQPAQDHIAPATAPNSSRRAMEQEPGY